MKCMNCGNEINDGMKYCTVCGAEQNLSAQNTQQATAPVSYAPALQFSTDRGLLKYILLSLITFGIYGMVTYSRIPDELNIVASRYDGRKTMPFFTMFFIMPYTLGILALVWQHNMANRIGCELRRRGYDYKFGASDFWLWNVLGSLILIGPFVYCYKLFKSMNMINASYNIYG